MFLHVVVMIVIDLLIITHLHEIFFHFRIILIAEKDTVYSRFPTPLINRLEKHFVLTSSILEKWQEAVLDTLVKWITDFSKLVIVVCLFVCLFVFMARLHPK